MADDVSREQLLEELGRLEERMTAWMAIEAKGGTYCLAFVCAFLARMLNFDRRALIAALEAEATHAHQARHELLRNADSDEPRPATAADYGEGPLRALAASLRAFAGPSSTA